MQRSQGQGARFRAVVFDWDGTLVDSTGLIAESILHAADDVGVPVPDRGLASHVIGLGMMDALARVVPDLPPAKIPDFVARFQAHYRLGEGEIRFFPGARQLLDMLRARGVLLAVATGKTHAGLARSLEIAGLQQHFSATRCADQTRPKPHPAMLHELQQDLALEPAQMLMIGDTSHDLQMAASAGVAAVAVAYGAHPRHELERLGPLAVFDAVEKLQDWILAHTHPPAPGA
jgi:phosphoglycolate phosphatase